MFKDLLLQLSTGLELHKDRAVADLQVEFISHGAVSARRTVSDAVFDLAQNPMHVQAAHRLRVVPLADKG